MLEKMSVIIFFSSSVGRSMVVAGAVDMPGFSSTSCISEAATRVRVARLSSPSRATHRTKISRFRKRGSASRSFERFLGSVPAAPTPRMHGFREGRVLGALRAAHGPSSTLCPVDGQVPLRSLGPRLRVQVVSTGSDPPFKA